MKRKREGLGSDGGREREAPPILAGWRLVEEEWKGRKTRKKSRISGQRMAAVTLLIGRGEPGRASVS